MRVLFFVVVTLLAAPGVAGAAVGDPCNDGTGLRDNNRCAGAEVCDSTTLTCRVQACTSDADCRAGSACNVGRGICAVGSGGPCTSDADCFGGERCDVAANVCISDPPDGTVDIGGDCLVDADCLAGDMCDETTGLCIAGGGTTGPGCISDPDCTDPRHSVCDTSRGICVECLTDADCTTACDTNNTCTGPSSAECTVDSDCTGGRVCDVGAGVCVALDTCASYADCPAGESCDNGVCSALPTGACLDDADCSADEACDVATGICAAIMSPGPGGSGPLVPGTLAPRGCSAADGTPGASWAALLMVLGAWLVVRRLQVGISTD
jgi:uncharacterized protein (TIGR03382 family)